MKKIYIPDRWVLLDMEQKDGSIVTKVFAGCSDTWQLNSGIESTRVFSDYFEFTGYTGSVYKCYKNSHGMSNYMASVYSSWMNSEVGKLIKVRI